MGTSLRPTQFGGGPSERDQVNWHLVGGLPYVTFHSVGVRGEIPPGHPAD